MKDNDTAFSPSAFAELDVLESVLGCIMDETKQTFEKRDVEAAARIEPLVQVAGDLIAVLRRNHLKRMSTGECNEYANTAFSDLMVEMQRIASVCSNVGVATVVRVHPELADKEHLYFERLHTGSDAAFNAAYELARNRFFPLLEKPEKAPSPAPADG